MEESVITSFKKNWQKARNDGWKIDNDYFYPSKDHIAVKNAWAAIHYKTDYGIIVPHWFVQFYPLA
jgi:hypothetical protein